MDRNTDEHKEKQEQHHHSRETVKTREEDAKRANVRALEKALDAEGIELYYIWKMTQVGVVAGLACYVVCKLLSQVMW